jgi:hypothetical protein
MQRASELKIIAAAASEKKLPGKARCFFFATSLSRQSISKKERDINV